ncbi:MAG: gliding motility-associated C-terminal domain-containing protein [Lewinellaceae bacterium]|nr:gliding motility-associated C-terminal domain-containing protein [Lewinellaceae bacterium]
MHTNYIQRLSLLLLLVLLRISNHAQSSIQKLNFDVKNFKKELSQRDNMVSIPTAIDSQHDFRISESDVMDDDFKKNYPEINAYRLLDDFGNYGSLVINDSKVWITYSIDGQMYAIVPNGSEFELQYGVGEPVPHACSVIETKSVLGYEFNPKEFNNLQSNRIIKYTVNTYRVAPVCTGEYYQAKGNNDSDVSASIVSTIASIQEIYLREVSIKLTALTPVLYKNPNTDPFTPDTNMGADSRPVQAGKVVKANFSLNSYDVGHAFHIHEDGDGWSNGGVARLACVCQNTEYEGSPLKGQGWSGAFASTAWWAWISLSAHEFGHMFSATHTFNGTGGSCTDNISDETAVEIGSGTTLMSYSGSCDDTQNIPDGPENQYFHSINLEQILTYRELEATCASIQNINNEAPVAQAILCNNDFTIPKSTPFYIEGNGTDLNNDNLTYTWEQINEDGPGHPTQGFIGTQAGNSPTAPNFRCFPPSKEKYRYFPELSTLANGITSDPFQVLSRRAKELQFNLTVRDNNPNGGIINSASLDVHVDGTGPFEIPTASNPSTLDAGESFQLNWLTNGSDGLCDKVSIRLSTDGGLTFPILLAEDVDYSSQGSMITIPTGLYNTSQARFMISCEDFSCTKFFCVSNKNFSINSQCTAQETTLCPIEDYEYDKGDPALDLDITAINGSIVNSFEKKIYPNSPTGVFVLYAENGIDCASFASNAYNHETTTISVNESGTYTFYFKLDGIYGKPVMTIFENNFNPTSPCSTFYTSNLQLTPDNFLSRSTILSAYLEKCKDYVLFLSNLEAPTITTKIDFYTGPGDVILHSDSDANFENTFIAVKQPSGIISAASAEADFTTLGGGTYQIHAVNYKTSGTEPPTNITEQDLVGQNFNELFNNDNCLYASAMYSTLIVNSDCSLEVELGTQSDCDPNKGTFTQELIISYDDPPTGNLNVNGEIYSLTGSPQTIVLTDLIADGSNHGITVYFTDATDCEFNNPNFFQAPQNCCPFNLDNIQSTYSYCEGNTLIVSNDNDNIQYEWYSATTLLSSGLTFIPSETGTYRVVAKNMGGCTVEKEFSVEIFPNPELTIDGPQALCGGEEITVMAITNENQVIWTKDNVELTETGFSLNISEQGLYSATVVNVAECSTKVEFNIEVHASPVAELGDDVIQCEGTTVTLTDVGNGGMTYKWFLNNVLLPDQGGSIGVTQPGVYRIESYSEFNCVGTDEVNVSFLSSPNIDAGSDITVCEGEQAIINASTDGNFKWYLDGQEINESSLSFTAVTGIYVLESSNDIGCTVSDTVVVNILSIPTVDLGEDKVACIGNNVLLEGPEGDYTYNWKLLGSTIETEKDLTVSTGGTYTLEVTNAANCSASDEINIDFVDGPTVDLGSDLETCEGKEIDIIAQTNGTDISWYRDDILISGENTATLKTGIAGDYKIVVKGSSGCESTDEIKLTVNPNPMISIGSDIEACEGNTVSLNFTNTNNYDLEWSSNGIVLGTSEFFSVPSSGTYQLKATNEFGCSSTDELIVTFYPLPSLELDDEYNFCENGSVIISATSNASTFDWYLNGNIVNGINTSSIEVDEQGIIKVEAISDKDCRAEAMATVISRQSPTVDIGLDQTLCPNSSIVLNAGDGAVLWNNGSTESTLEVLSPNPTQPQSETFSVTVTNEFDCTATDEVMISYLPVVVASVSTDLNGLCNGETMTLTASGGTTYSWNDPTATLSSTTGNIVIASPSVTTEYSVVVSDNCPNNSDEATVEVVVFTRGSDVTAGMDTCVVIGRSLDLEATGGVFYLWQDDPTILGSTTSSSISVSPAEETTYYVEIEDFHGCLYQDSVTVCVVEDPLSIFVPVTMISPNGDGKNDALEFEGLESFPDNSLQVFNRWGNLIYEKNGYQTDDNRFNGTESGEPLPEGTYYYVLKFDQYVFKKALTIIRD